MLAVIVVSSVHMKLEDWVDGRLHGAPPEIASEELELDNASALYAEHLPVLELMHTLEYTQRALGRPCSPPCTFSRKR